MEEGADNWNEVLEVCTGKQRLDANFTYRELIGLALTNGVTNLTLAVVAICKQYNGDFGFYLELINNLARRRAIDFDFGLTTACENGSREMIDLMIKKGAKNLNVELVKACRRAPVRYVSMVDRGRCR